jgi:prepilin-type N-terminal cleavage/methylation domain-containing protein
VRHSFTKARVSIASALGFTLIELMVVMSLIVILATVGLVQYRQSIAYTKEAVLKDDLNKLRDAIDQYYAEAAPKVTPSTARRSQSSDERSGRSTTPPPHTSIVIGKGLTRAEPVALRAPR